MSSSESETFTGEFVTLSCADGLELDAIWIPGIPQTERALIHIHGKGGNFFTNKFLRHLYAQLPKQQTAILGVNTRGAGALVESYQGGRIVYTGSANEMFDDSIMDIEAAVAFCLNYTDDVILQGHSHGCEKIFHYAQRTLTQRPLILISPADSAELQRIYRPNETFAEQAGRIIGKLNKNAWDLLDETEYGIAVNGSTYNIPITDKALADWLQSGIRTFDHLVSDQPRITNPVLILFGGKDPLQVVSLERFELALAHRMPNAIFHTIPNTNHHFRDAEHELLRAILAWIRTQ